MSMQSQLSNLLLANALLGIGGEIGTPARKRNILPDSGDSHRSHKQNVKRRRLRRISKISKAINRK